MSIDETIFGRIQLQHISVNNLIQWGDHLSVEHPGIDAQHKAIFDLGINVYEIWRGGASIDVLRPVVDKLEELLKTHFSYEEGILAKIGYEGLELHRAEHRAMLDDMEIIQKRFLTLKYGHKPLGGSVLAPGWPIMQFLLGFAVGHVMSSDMSFCRALIASRDEAQRTT
jgi:hemerythrin